MSELALEHRNRTEVQEPGILGIGTTPSFAIGQRVLHVDGRLVGNDRRGWREGEGASIGRPIHWGTR